MNKFKTVFWLCAFTVLIAGNSGCKNVQTNNDSQAENIADSMDGHTSDQESVLFLLPSPGEILLRFYSADFQYNPELLNSPLNKDKYIGSKAQTLNLGVYITDMAYSALFERSAETVNYLEAVQALSTETGISSTIFESLLVRSKANAGKLDSLANISNEAFSNMLEFLETGGKENTIAQVSAGAYIESLFIALQSIGSYSEDNEALELLSDMRFPVDNLLEKAKSATLNEADKTIINYLIEISTIFNDLEKSSSKTVVTQNPSGEVSIQGGEELKMNEANFIILKNKVAEIRKGIVSY